MVQKSALLLTRHGGPPSMPRLHLLLTPASQAATGHGPMSLMHELAISMTYIPRSLSSDTLQPD